MVLGTLSTREPLDRETKCVYELVAEAKDQGMPARSSRVALRIKVTDVNDNAPVIDDPQEDVISVREEQPAGIEVVRVRAVDPDDGYNATISYSIVKGKRDLRVFRSRLTFSSHLHIDQEHQAIKIPQKRTKCCGNESICSNMLPSYP